MKIYLATWLQEDSQKEALDKIGKQERLLSYYLVEQSEKSIVEYMEK